MIRHKNNIAWINVEKRIKHYFIFTLLFKVVKTSIFEKI